MNKQDKIYVAGHRGMVGSAILRRLHSRGFENILTRSSSELDLRNQNAVETFFLDEMPAYVFLAAARVGGIHANNTYRADFIYDNIMIEANIIHAAYKTSAKKLLFLGSSCIYPKLAPQPIKEEHLLTGVLESTNEPYAIAKIAGIKLCEAYRDQHGCNFISAMPTNLYGQGDNYHHENSHVLPALIRRFDSALQESLQEVEIWGTGKPQREFMYVDDLAEASLFLMENYNGREFINVGTGDEVTIKELAEIIASVVGFTGKIVFNTEKPDGTPRKLMDSSKIHKLGWHHRISLKKGIQIAYEHFQKERQLNLKNM